MTKDSYITRQNWDDAEVWKHSKPLLRLLDVELTERCNNNCIHCLINIPASDVEAEEMELSCEEIKAVLKEAASLGCLTIRFTGGEPLLRDDFEELYLYARRLGMRVLLFTNATLITPHIAELFSHVPPMKEVEVTVYGMKRGSYEAVTRKSGSFEAAFRGMGLLLENDVPFVVKGALLPPNIGDMEEFEAWASTIPWMDKPPTHSIFLDLRCRRDPEKNRLIKRLRPSPEEGVRALTRRKEDYLRGTKEFCSKFMSPPGEGLFSCSAGLDSCCLDAYGYLQPCLLLKHPDASYDLKSGSLGDAMRNFFPRYRMMKASNSEYLARCARCFLKGLCEQCPAKSWTEHGTLDTPVEYLCEVAHVKARYLGILDDGERAWEVENWRERIEKMLKDDPKLQE